MTSPESGTATPSPLATSSPRVHGRGATSATAEPDAASAAPAGSRRAGVVLHVTAIPGPDGVGDLGALSRQFVDWLATAGQRAWQPLPLHPAPSASDPWSIASAFAGDPMLISLDDLVELGLLPDTLPEIRASVSARATGADALAKASRWKPPLLRQAARQLLSLPPGNGLVHEYLAYCEREAYWLADHVACAAMREQYPGVPRTEWPVEDRVRRLGAHRARSLDIGATHQHPEAAIQFLFDRQLRRLHEHATDRDVWLIADVPAFVADDSSDVWAHPDLFLLDSEQRATARAGEPPDARRPGGEVWQVVPPDWKAHAARDFDWWRRRLRHEAIGGHVLRLDHARSFADWWRLPPRAGYGDQGQWDPGPGTALLEAIGAAVGELELFADDAGVETPELVELRAATPLPAARVLARGLTDGAGSRHLPQHWTSEDIVYTGDARSGTIAAWTRAALADAADGAGERLAFALRTLGTTEPADVPRAAIESVMTSPARIALVPFGDWLGLAGAEHNTSNRAWVAPSGVFSDEQLPADLATTAARTRRTLDA